MNYGIFIKIYKVMRNECYDKFQPDKFAFQRKNIFLLFSHSDTTPAIEDDKFHTKV